MTDTHKSLKLALEALESCDAAHITDGGHQWYDEKLVDKAITAIEEALMSQSDGAQPEQSTTCGEPVAWMSKDADIVYASIQVDGCFHNDHIPLYTAPYVATPRPQRTWVGLTDDEIQPLLSQNRFAVFALIRAIEAKLKEKNT